jgi:hypothetical protein
MMMSVSTAEPRTRCIRCGGVEFRFVEKWEPARGVPVPFVPRPSSADRARSSRELATIGLAAAEPIGEGAYI